jgi:DNA-binding protein HU-beta
MEKVNRSELLERVAKKKGIQKRQLRDFYDAFVEEIKDSLCEGKDVSLTGFGTFGLQKHRGHPVQFTPDSDVVKDYVVLKFTVSDVLMTDIRNHYGEGAVPITAKKG